MATNVTNQQVLDALKGLGYTFPSDFDMTGAQNSTWGMRVLEYLKGSGQNADPAIFTQGKDTARKLADIDPNASPLEKLSQQLSAYGVSGDDLHRVMDEAVRIRKSTPGIYAAGTTFNEQEYAQAAANVLGADNPAVKSSTASIGLQLPASPAQAPLSMAPQDDKIGPHPGVAAVAQTQANVAAKRPPAGTAPAGAGGAPGGGGGPNNTPTIDNPANWSDDRVKTWLKQNLGSDAWFIDIPEVWSAMKDAVKSGKGPGGADAAFKATSFYLQSDSKARLWYQYEREDPASAGTDVAKQTETITKLARDAGIDIDPTRAQQMAASYLRYGWSQADLQQALGAEWHYDPSTKTQAAAVTQMKSQAQDWLVPLSDQAIQTWGQGLISGTVTQDQFTQYLRDNAKSLMPQLSSLIDQHANDPNFSVSTFADPYKQQAAQLLGIQPDQINLNDSKWRQALDTQDPKTGERRIMTLGEWESKIKTDKSFGYDNTANGIKDGLSLADALKTSMGY